MVAPVRVDVTETIWIQWKERDDHHQRSDAEEDAKQDDLVKNLWICYLVHSLQKTKTKEPGHKALKKKS